MLSLSLERLHNNLGPASDPLRHRVFGLWRVRICAGGGIRINK